MLNQRHELYESARRLALAGQTEAALSAYRSLEAGAEDRRLRAQIANDRGTLEALRHRLHEARLDFARALSIDPGCRSARKNLELLNSERPGGGRPLRIAILSLLFNWPSTGGGTIHTTETARFLNEAGFEVLHFSAQFAPWNIGMIRSEPPFPVTSIEFSPDEWNAATIQRRFRDEVDRFAPDAVIVTDSWNTKGLLAEAVAHYPYFLRLAAQECLCPLNNLRLLVEESGKATSCGSNQLASPGTCRQCVASRNGQSGGLHRAERGLAEFDHPDYGERLRRVFANAESILVVNPAIGRLVEPFAKRVSVIPSGFDPKRFQWPLPSANTGPRGRFRIVFAGVPGEFIKGFHVLRAACETLWHERQDFEVVVTGDTLNDARPYERFVGWQSQTDLPQTLRSADVLVFPTIAEDALGRTAVEALAVGRPVVASRIGGLRFTVRDGETGLLFEPGNPKDLAAKLRQLMDDRELCGRLGTAGREDFERRFPWPIVIERDYRPLLESVTAGRSGSVTEAPAARLGCVIAIRNRSVQVLERTLQTYGYQTVQPFDRVLLDYGSDPPLSEDYRKRADTHGWRFVRVDADTWSLSAAYNRAVEELDASCDIVFKSDVDVLLGEDVLQRAVEQGRNRLCIFSCRTTTAETAYPKSFDRVESILHLTPTAPMDGEGIHAFPRDWFSSIGGFDLQFQGWGYEDSDLRHRANASIGVVYENEALLVHQWHPRCQHRAEENRDYYERTKSAFRLVRNGEPSSHETHGTQASQATQPSGDEVVIATRSMWDDLYDMSGELLNFQSVRDPARVPKNRVKVTGSNGLDYFRTIRDLPVDWAINMDEDAFLIDPNALVDLLGIMETEGYAACGMPDGGVVPIRRHNPLACNAFFNIFDLRRVRRVWSDWDKATACPIPEDWEDHMPELVGPSPYELDDFEPYYGLFFALIGGGERMLYLDAETWEDGVSTLLKAPDDRPLLLHTWYARMWRDDPETRARIRNAFRAAQSCELQSESLPVAATTA